MTIVKANLSHLPYLCDFGRTSFIHAYQCTLPLEELTKYINDAFSESTIREEIKGELATYFVYTDEKLNPCGYAKLIQSPPPECISLEPSIELQRLYVDSAFRGQGIGKLLEKYTESHSTAQNISNLWLRVWNGNTVAKDIYEKWGFSVVGEEFYVVGKEQRTVLVMQKTLSKTD